ncbi:type I restriction enzyme S subunit [Bradyrhizobium ottawaense]|uniref:restriction endonuclease subunit S n=1 Tax=Bradyrhizobium ottawaense TaxID=931866 RepID=UPI003833BDE0
MSTAWKTKALREICKIRPPKGEAREKLDDPDLVSFVPMEDLGVGQKFLEPKVERKLEQVAGSYTYFAEGDVLLAKITPCFENGKLGIAKGLTNGIGFGSSEYIVFRPNENLSNEFLYYFLLQDSFRAEGTKTMSGAVGHKRVSKEFIERCQIPLPPLPEQQRVVAILNEAFAGLATATANAEKNLKSARELFDSVLNSIFQTLGRDWPNKKLGEITEVQSGGTPSRSQKAYWNGDLPWYSSGELNDLTTSAAAEGISALGLENSNAKRFPKGSLLIGMYDTAAMKMSITDREAAFNQAIAGLKPNSTLDLVFVLHALLVVKAAVLDLRRGVRQKNLSLEKVKNVEIKLPDIETQKEIVQQLLSFRTAVAALESTYQRKLANISELKQSILQKAFSGELTSPPSQVIAEAAE